MSYHEVFVYESLDTTRSYENSGTDLAENRGYAMVMEAEKFRFRTEYLNTRVFLDEHSGSVSQ